jgi:hypothetical protein
MEIKMNDNWLDETPEQPDYVSSIEEIIAAEVNKRCKDIQSQWEQFNDKYWEVVSEATQLKQELENKTKHEVSTDFVTNNILAKINKDNIEHLLEIILTKTHNEDGGMDCPLWFKLFVNYYNDKELVFKLFDIASIEYPKYAKTIRLPYEWNEQEIDLFFDTMKNHYVCNGSIYRSNLGFWYREWRYFDFDITKGLNHNYSQVPWQLLLKNPLLNTVKYAHKMAESIDRYSHGGYFIEIFKYQNLSSEIKKIVFKEMNRLPEMSMYDYYQLTENNLDSLPEEWLNKYFGTLLKEKDYSSYYIEKINKLPKEYIYKFLKQCKDVFAVLPKINLTSEEKVEFVKSLG